MLVVPILSKKTRLILEGCVFVALTGYVLGAMTKKLEKLLNQRRNLNNVLSVLRNAIVKNAQTRSTKAKEITPR